jgi:hypothetical protein
VVQAVEYLLCSNSVPPKKKEKSMLNFSLLFKCGNHLKFLSKTNGQTKKIYSKIELYYLLGHHNSEETM